MLRLRILTVFLLLSPSVFSATNWADWKYKADITIGSESAEYCQFALTPQIYNVCRQDLADIRIVDSRLVQVPYVINKAADTETRVEYSPSLINRTANTTGAAAVTLDFGKQVLKNSLNIETAGNNFRRAVKIEGSNDNVTFFTVVERAFVFAVDNFKKFNRIEMPVNDYRYLRITVFPMDEEGRAPVINSVEAVKTEKLIADRQNVNMTMLNHEEDANCKNSIYTYDTGFSNLPLTEIKLNIADKAFYRYVYVEGRDAEKRKMKIDSEDEKERFVEVNVPWSAVVSGTIYRYINPDGNCCENTVLRLLRGNRSYWYLRIIISNYDDRPLTIDSASANMIPHSVIFEKPAGVSLLKLHVGCESASAPVYDLMHRITLPLKAEAAQAKIGELVSEPAKSEKILNPWSEKHKALLLVMAVVLVVLAVIIVKSFISIQREQKQD